MSTLPARLVLLFFCLSLVSSPSDVSARTSPVVVAMKAARKFFVALTTGKRELALARSAVPFSVDRKKVVKSRKELAKVFDKIIKKTAGKNLKISSADLAPNNKICREPDVPKVRYVVRLMVKKEPIDICLTAKWKVVGFSD